MAAQRSIKEIGIRKVLGASVTGITELLTKTFLRLVTHDEDERMPQKDDPLPDAQVTLFKQWIAEGARLDSGDAKSSLADLMPKQDTPRAPEKYPRPLPVTALAFSEDGGSFWSSGYHEVLEWSAADGKLLLSTGRDTTLRICQLEDGKEVAALGAPRGGQFKDWLSALAISPDQSTVAATDIAGVVHVWRLA